MDILACVEDQGVIEVYREESVEVGELVNIFNRFDQRICVFHYAGHAGGDKLLTEGGDANAQGLAKLLIV